MKACGERGPRNAYPSSSSRRQGGSRSRGGGVAARAAGAQVHRPDTVAIVPRRLGQALVLYDSGEGRGLVRNELSPRVGSIGAPDGRSARGR
jgi:hypothetical protein